MKPRYSTEQPSLMIKNIVKFYEEYKMITIRQFIYLHEYLCKFDLDMYQATHTCDLYVEMKEILLKAWELHEEIINSGLTFEGIDIN